MGDPIREEEADVKLAEGTHFLLLAVLSRNILMCPLTNGILRIWCTLGRSLVLSDIIS